MFCVAIIFFGSFRCFLFNLKRSMNLELECYKGDLLKYQGIGHLLQNIMSFQVRDFYCKKNIFITGSTGFVGIVLLEKLLRTIPNLGTVYLLLRPKKENTVYDRILDLKKHSIFDKLREENNIDEIFQKVVPINGDIEQEELGLSTEDRRKLVENVNVVFHVAASIDFTANLKSILHINVIGTRTLVNLCKTITNLEVLVHMSSSFANTWRNDPEEIIYDLKLDVDKIMQSINEVSEKELEKNTAKILGPFLTSYSFSKYLAEFEILKIQHLIPCTLVRPSIITGIWQDPIAYHPIGTMGPHEFLFGFAQGVVRRLPGDMNMPYDYIPIDTVANSCIVAGCHAATEQVKEATIYHCSSNPTNPLVWNKVLPYLNSEIHNTPFESAVWYPRLKIQPNFTLFKIASVIFHILPALVLDGLLLLTREKPFVTKSHLVGLNMLCLCEPYTVKEWKYFSNKRQELHKWLSPQEQKLYNLDISTLDWPKYFNGLVGGLKKYVAKESLENIQVAKRKDSILKVVHVIFQGVVFVILWSSIGIILDLTLISPLGLGLFSLVYYYIIYNIL